MKKHNHNLHEQRRKLEDIEARLARHERRSRIILILMMLLGAVALGLFLDHLLGRGWSRDDLSGFIP
ncbi:hypothetical protein [Microvirga subterranea]|uniref:Uncharacterized protein n=1 Tax=Microvirga subterranea TaxID=186651 RepID=A0A370HPS1_9HYPH|nr:hypothetical protein [Microvirga subterranea]RDI60255.1 hypothetical protein DES45_103517 [Microvirga subterranea]